MTKKLQDLQPTSHYFIGIDPDVDKNGVAIVEKESRHLECAALTFADTLDYLQWVAKRAYRIDDTWYDTKEEFVKALERFGFGPQSPVKGGKL